MALFISGINDIKDVRQEVVGIKSTYYQFGIALGLPVGELDSIRRAFHQVIDQAFDEVLLLWLRQRYDVQRHGLPTWRRLVEAVDSPNGGGDSALAMNIASRRHLSGMTGFLPPFLSLSLSLSKKFICIYTVVHLNNGHIAGRTLVLLREVVPISEVAS